MFSQCEGYEEERMKLKPSIFKWSVLVSSTTLKWATTEYETGQLPLRIACRVPVLLLITVSLWANVLVMSGTVAVETPVISIAVKNREWSRIKPPVEDSVGISLFAAVVTVFIAIHTLSVPVMEMEMEMEMVEVR